MINMLKKTGITIVKKLGESLAAEVFLAKNENTAKSLLIKKIRPKFIAIGIKEHIEQQQIYLNRLYIKQIIIPELQFDNNKTLLLIQPCTEGQLLRKWLTGRKQIDITTLLKIGIALANCLSIRHQAMLIHKAVKPSNILIQENPIRTELFDEIRILDSMQLSQFIQNSQYRCETLPYIAPELTGRIRMNIDYCSDLYALGTVLYECATGQPPFFSHDSMHIIHSHLAEKPQAVSELNTNCPPILSNIIATLLQKQPEQRYQSAKGLHSDLQTCLSLLEKSNSNAALSSLPAFELRQQEASNHIIIPSVMVGRDFQKQQILDEYDRVCTGKLGVVMISGFSGIGKTRLVQELERPIIAKHGYYTSGKFNQFTKHQPYSTLIQAFRRLIRQLLTEDTEHLSYWRHRIQDACTINGQLLIDIIPELETVIGKQPEILALPPVEAHNRFNDITTSFIACFASHKHPLVLFIDDLQWCDHATFNLLELIYSQPEKYPYLLIIGAYRNNEVDKHHRVIQMTEAIKDSSQTILTLHIEPLDKTSVNQMVAFILNTYASRTLELTYIIHSVSAGNPLYINESLRWLHQKKGIYLSEKGLWLWNLNILTDLKLPDNAKDLFYDKLKQLPTHVINLLSTAAILGTQFEATDLAQVAQMPLHTLYFLLSDVFNLRILYHDKTMLSFSHDQIQAAAASFLNDEQKRACHKQIARTFIDLSGEKENTSISATRLFSIVEHLTAAGHSDDSCETELHEAARFNYLAGVTAINSLALDTCFHYFSQSAKLCSDSLWKTNYDFMFSLYKKLARAALVNGDQKRSSITVGTALKYAQTDLDRAEYLYEQTVAYVSMGNLTGSMDLARRALTLIDKTLPQTEDEIQIEISHIIEKLHQNNRDIWQEIIDAPDISERKYSLELNLYSEILPSLYFSGQIPMFELMAIRTLSVALDKGVGIFICMSLSIMAFYFQMRNNYQHANSYEDVMFKMVKRFPNSFGLVRAMTCSIWMSIHSRLSIFDLTRLCKNTINTSKNCGDLQYAGHTNCSLLWYEFIQSKNLNHMKIQIETMVNFSKQFNLAITTGIGEALQMSLAPLWESDSTYSDKSYVFTKLNTWKTQKYAVSLGCYFVFNGIVSYYTGRYFQAEQSLKHAEIYLIGIKNTIVYRLWYVFKYLVVLQRGHGKNTRSYLEQVLKWASHGPILKPYLALMQAETIAQKGDLRETRIIFQDAIDIAHKEQYLFLEAFLNERLWQYLKKINHHSKEFYLDSAILLYQHCGAVCKASQLSGHVKEQPSCKTKSTKKHITKINDPDQKNINIDQKFNKELDFNYLFGAVKAIAGELDFNKLLSIVVKSVMARLGAKTGYLIIVKKELLVPYVYGIKKEYVQVKFKDESGFSIDKLSMGITYYVFHSKKKLILNNAFEQGEFVSDVVVQKEKLRSVLCLPIIKNKEVLGVLYLENSLIKSVFTDTQIELADLLAAQAAIALQNAFLLRNIKSAHATIELMNQDLEHRFAKRTKELHEKQLELTHASRLASLGELATGIAHELGQPLQIIKTASAIIRDEIENDTFNRAEVLPITKEISMQVDKAAVIIGNMRTYARYDDALPPKAIDICIPFRQCLVFFKEQFHHHQINLKLLITDKLPDVRINPQKFQQITVNLLSNARFAVDTKKIQPGIRYQKQIIVRLYLTANNKKVIMEIEDNGAGMSYKTQQRCLEPFFTTKKPGEGTGLGLSIIYGIMRQFDFELKITSKIDKGSLFKVSMPVAQTVTKH